VATVTAVAWALAAGPTLQVAERVATVLVTGCPHALGLAVPLVVAITTSLGAANGILVRDRLALEQAWWVGIVVFDKAGTLTLGEFRVVAIATAARWSEDEALALAAAVEGDAEHTMARAIPAEAKATLRSGVSGQSGASACHMTANAKPACRCCGKRL